MSEFIYRVNAEDNIVSVDANWTRFAVENGLALPIAEKMAGNSLWDYLSDLTTRHLYRIFMHRVRQSGHDIMVPFRCDAPDRRRFMRMTIARLPDSGVEFRSVLLHEEPRAIVPLLDPGVPRRADFLEMCSWCKKIRAPDWMEVEEAVERLKLFEATPLPWVSHGCCPDCEHRLEQELG
jgi:hypothetical protein